MLLKLCGAWKSRGVELEVISMVTGGFLVDQFRALGIPVVELGMRRGALAPWAAGRFLARLEAARPDVLQTWMYHADLLGAAVRMFNGRLPLVWNIRHADMAHATTKAATRRVAKLCAMLSRSGPDLIFCCSEEAAKKHQQFGYWGPLFRILPNGFELERFKRDEEARSSVRAELGLNGDTPVFGQVARFHPIKGHGLMLEAFAKQDPAAHLVLCGEGISDGETQLVRSLERLGIRDRCHLLGRRGDVPRVMASLDVLVSPSLGEGFPNAVGEAMACETPCVVTDVGDSALAVGGYGWVVPPNDPDALAEAMRSAMSMPEDERRILGAEGRRYITENFEIGHVAERYLGEYASLTSGAI